MAPNQARYFLHRLHAGAQGAPAPSPRSAGRSPVAARTPKTRRNPTAARIHTSAPGQGHTSPLALHIPNAARDSLPAPPPRLSNTADPLGTTTGLARTQSPCNFRSDSEYFRGASCPLLRDLCYLALSLTGIGQDGQACPLALTRLFRFFLPPDSAEEPISNF